MHRFHFLIQFQQVNNLFIPINQSINQKVISSFSFSNFKITGRILNRFTKDMGIIDEQLPLAAYDLNLVGEK